MPVPKTTSSRTHCDDSNDGVLRGMFGCHCWNPPKSWLGKGFLSTKLAVVVLTMLSNAHRHSVDSFWAETHFLFTTPPPLHPFLPESKHSTHLSTVYPSHLGFPPRVIRWLDTTTGLYMPNKANHAKLCFDNIKTTKTIKIGGVLWRWATLRVSHCVGQATMASFCVQRNHCSTSRILIVTDDAGWWWFVWERKGISTIWLVAFRVCGYMGEHVYGGRM